MKKFLGFILFLLAAPTICTVTGQRQVAAPSYLDGVLYIHTPALSGELDDAIPLWRQKEIEWQVTRLYRPFSGAPSQLASIYRLEFNAIEETETIIAFLNLIPAVQLVEKVPLNKITYVPDDVNPESWYLDRLEAFAAWDITRGDSSVTIAIVDNAVRTTHEDLAANIWQNPGETDGNLVDDDLNLFVDDKQGYDVADMDNDPNPPADVAEKFLFLHGTHVAGIASGVSDNGLGIASLGYSCTLIPVKVTPDESEGDVITHGYEGIFYAAQTGADIINMSWGGFGQSLTGSLILDYVADQGIVLIAAAGNNDTTDLFFPAADPDVMAVAASNRDDDKASFSNFGNYVEVSAPGRDIFSMYAADDHAYGFNSGTSMACPMVAGLAGLILSVDSALSAERVREIIRTTSDPMQLSDTTWENLVGAGRINARRAVEEAALISGVEENGDRTRVDLTVYPNPATDRIYIANVPPEGDIRITSGDGRLIRQVRRAGTISLKGLEPGLYHLHWVGKRTIGAVAVLKR